MDTQEKNRFFNYRPFLSICLFFVAGIICVVNFYIGKAFNIVLATIMCICLILTFIIKLIKSKSQKLFKLLSIVIAFAVSAGLSVCFIELYKAKPNYNGEYLVSGRVCERTYLTDKDKVVITLDNVSVTSLETLEKDGINGKVRLYLNLGTGNSEGFVLGEEVYGTTELSKIKLFDNKRNNFSLYNKKIYYLGFGEEDDIVSKNKINPTFFEKIKNKVKDSLDANLSHDYSELAYTMLFGDKAGLSEEIKAGYSASGIGHLLAVSGLHVGFIVTMLSFILKKCKANRAVTFWVIISVVFLYALLCGFTVSVLRAFIMTAVMLYARLRLFQYDSLSSLSVAALIILISNPLWLFDAGFQLSFLAVLGIIILAPIFTRFFSKFLHKKLAETLAVCISAQIAVLPVMFTCFSTFSIFSVITNLLCIPIASVAFMFLFVTVILSLIIPPLGILAYVFEALMKVVTGISSITGAISIANSEQWTILLFSIVLLACAMLASDYLFFKGKGKKIAVICLVVGVFVSFAMIFII